MKKNETLALIILILVTFGIGLGVFGVNKYRGKKLYTAELIAREPDHGNWYPRKITVSHGKEVKLLIRNIETVTHGFALPDFNVAVPEIKAGTVAEVRFTPDKKGTFPFMCTIWCSPRHMEMTGELIVE
ncbi:MAG: cupredoxin domain-containing protein [bacterium]|jgi:heme/copper-type cytochrome/quinol oxidase subunit 2|nr:cupredoxin domain-containing protein [bacterium]